MVEEEVRGRPFVALRLGVLEFNNFGLPLPLFLFFSFFFLILLSFICTPVVVGRSSYELVMGSQSFSGRSVQVGGEGSNFSGQTRGKKNENGRGKVLVRCGM